MNEKQKLFVNYQLLKCAGVLPKKGIDKESSFILPFIARAIPRAVPFLARRLPLLARFVGRFAPEAISAGERVVPSLLDRMIGRSGRYAKNFLSRATSFKNIPALLPRGARWLEEPLGKGRILSHISKGDLLALNPITSGPWFLYRYPKFSLGMFGASKLMDSMLPPAPPRINPMTSMDPRFLEEYLRANQNFS